MGRVRSTGQTRKSLAAIAGSSPIHVDATPKARLTLRPLTEADREAFINVLCESRAELDAFAPLHNEGESDESVFERQLFLTQEGERTGRALRRLGVLGDGRIAGAFNLNAISRGLELRADVNLWVATSCTGRGVATEGLRQLMALALAPLPEGLGLHKLEAGVQRGNTASTRVLEKAGFVRDDTERTHLRTGSTWALHDIYVHQLSRTD